MNDDASLLRSYVDQGSEAAFAELVRRRVDLVYGAALRRTGGDSHRAADVAQQVFTQLARHARKLSRHTVVSAWLHTATRNAALNLVISEQRRQARETASLVIHASDAASPDWARLRPLLDEAIDELPDLDRSAVVLRFLEQRAFAEIGATLRLSEDTARKRVERALEKLRDVLARRGVKSTSAALATVFANQVAANAPAGLAATITGAALTATSASVAVGVGLFMSLKSTIILGAIALAAIGSTAYEWSRAFRAENELAALTVDRDGLQADLRAERQRAAQASAALRSELDALKARQIALQPVPPAAPAGPKPAAPVMSVGKQQLTMVNYLRQIAAARDQYLLENKHPPASLDELVGETKYIRRIVPVDGENYAGVPLTPGQPLTVTTANGITAVYDEATGNQTQPAFTPEEQREFDHGQAMEAAMNKAQSAYRAANGRKPVQTLEALLPYFATPQEAADFWEYVEAQKAAAR